MHRADRLGHLAGSHQVGCPLQADCEGVELWPPSIDLVTALDTFCGVFLGDGRGDGGVESTGEQHAIGHVTHQLPLNGCLQRIVHILCAGGVVFHVVILHPVAGVPAGHLFLLAVIVVSREEGLIFCGETLQALQLGRDHQVSLGIMTYI